MTTVKSLLRCTQKFGRVQQTAARFLQSFARPSSAPGKSKVVEGEKGERIVTSPFGQVEVPELTIQDYVWRDLGNYLKHTALECAVTGRKYKYAEARDATNFVAKSLLNMGLKRDDVVAVIAPNYPESVLAFLGILEAQLIVTTVNPFYTVGEIAYQLKSSGAKAVITVAEIAGAALAAAKECLPQGAPFIVIEDKSGPIPEGTIPFQDLLMKGRTLPALNLSDVPLDSVAVLPYSSGTTGLPKGVMLSHKNLVANMEMQEAASKEIWYPTTETYQEVIPLFLPFFHIFGMNGVVLPKMMRGTKLVTMPKFVPETFADVLENHKVTGLFCVPPIVIFMAMSPLIKKHHLNSVHAAVSGAAPLSGTDVEKVYRKFELTPNDLKFCQGYGLTESSPVSFLEKTGTKYSSIGRNIAGCDARVVDPMTNKDVLRSGQAGELWIRGPHVMKGYLNNEEATKATIDADGWLKTGDIGYFDEDLDFFVTDRLKELIKVKGFQVAPAELEALLRAHPDVEEAAVVGIPDERCGEVPIAFVVPRKDKKPCQEDIQNFVKANASEHKELKGGVKFIDSIPRNPSGKILRTKLKVQYLS